MTFTRSEAEMPANRQDNTNIVIPPYHAVLGDTTGQPALIQVNGSGQGIPLSGRGPCWHCEE